MKIFNYISLIFMFAILMVNCMKNYWQLINIIHAEINFNLILKAEQIKEGFCPQTSPDLAGICVHECKGDMSCPGTLKCVIFLFYLTLYLWL